MIQKRLPYTWPRRATAAASVRDKPKKLRLSFMLTPDERKTLDQLPYAPATGEFAWRFWRTVARERGLDYKTIIGDEKDRSKFTALPLDHGKHWCFPEALTCTNPPPQHVFGVPAQ
jgi:hypothetical protein